MIAGCWYPYFAELLGTLLFLLIILVAVSTLANQALFLALLIGFGLFVGIYLSVLLGGPGYLNPAVALMLGVRNSKTAAYTLGMIAVELIAVIIALALLAAATRNRCTWRFWC